MGGIDASERKLWETTHSEGDDVRSCGESESLSDIDDAEVNSYLNNEKEKHYKKIIWEKINQKYLQEQEAKKTAANAAKPKKESKQKRTTGVKKTQSTAETADPTSSKKRCSSRINYDALSKILGEPVPSDSSKKRKTELLSDQNARKDLTDAQVDDDELNAAGEDEEENGWEEEEPQDYAYYSNQEEEHNYYDDDELF